MRRPNRDSTRKLNWPGPAHGRAVYFSGLPCEGRLPALREGKEARAWGWMPLRRLTLGPGTREKGLPGEGGQAEAVNTHTHTHTHTHRGRDKRSSRASLSRETCCLICEGGESCLQAGT